VYGWPRGYAAAVAQVGAYGNCLVEPVQGLADRSLAELYDPAGYRASPAIGFDPATGQPVGIDCATLTNIAFAELLAVIDSRNGATLLDTQLLDDRTRRPIIDGPSNGARPRTFYRMTPDEGRLPGPATAMALDALTDVTTLAEARQLAQGLLEIRPARTTVERAAFTLLAIAAFGGDPFTTIRLLQEYGPLLTPSRYNLPPDFTEFMTFWDEFRKRHDGSAELAAPDLEALRLLDELSRSRESAKSIDMGPPTSEGPRFGRSVLPATIRALMLTDGERDQDPFIFYDGDLAPGIPVYFNNVASGATLTIYRVRELPGLARLSNLYLCRRSIGITADVDDLTIVKHHRRDHTDTLTNQFGRYAVLCESGRARAVWLPGVYA
jgi:hypothetical protein